MKKIGIILMSMFLTAVVFQSCQIDDQSALTDPRDAIAKMWRVSDSGDPNADYDVTIAKDGTDVTKITLDNFHNLQTTQKVSAILASKIITIPMQDIIEGSTTYTIDGEGVISNDNESIVFEYTINDGDGEVNYIAGFGKVITAKKKLIVASLLQ